jgi:hypothetical protein
MQTLIFFSGSAFTHYAITEFEVSLGGPKTGFLPFTRMRA